MEYIDKYFSEVGEIIEKLDREQIREAIEIIVNVRKNGGRMFILGVGGSAANASHAVNDFRKIAGIETYTPTDNVSELTARTNDDGFESVFVNWLKTSKLNEKDCLLILSVGGGNAEKNVSVNLINAIHFAKEVKAKIIGIVGRDGGFTGKNAESCILVPVVNAESITPHSEAFQSVVLHLIVSHPEVKAFEMKWESTK